ncbi:MAG: T9SS type A sorting domain-containing protein [Saprospiraceae bacterium]|nr:T9SS type A sorting domain-containing protein [Saprospiraceae bacterium]
MLFKMYFIPLCFWFLTCFSLFAQHDEPCGQAHVTRQWFVKHPEKMNNYEVTLEKIYKNLKNKHIENRNDTLYTIPVVFHILHLNGPENVSDEQIFDQIRILNRDYQKMNADTSMVVPAFKNNIAKVNFAFKLATIDPDGYCTNGIVRHYTPKTVWNANNLADFTYTWPPEKYLNVYVVRSINIAPAYTFLPGIGIPESADAIVIQHNIMGSIGTASVANSRALTHEVGHWFGLPHTWGVTNAPGVACGDDFVEDTPLTKGFTTCAINNSKICDPLIEENVQNYMDYAPCKLMFTNGQSDYMHETINLGLNKRNLLISDENLIATGVTGNNPCAVKADFEASSVTICKGQSVVFTNRSQTGDATGSLLWNFEGGLPATSTDSTVETTFSDAGDFLITLIVTSPNGTDTTFRYISVIDGENGKKPEHIYSFSGEFLPDDLEVYNIPEDVSKWEIQPFVGANQTEGCVYLNNFSNPAFGAKRDFFQTGFFDLSQSDKPEMSFYYAYAKRYENQADSFRMEYTFDCGETWKNYLGLPSPNTMANNTGKTRNTAFEPSGDQEWRKLTLSGNFANIFKNKPSVRFRFYFGSDSNNAGSNNMYLDEINITDEVSTATKELSPDIFEVFPNPSNGVVNLLIPFQKSLIAGVTLTDITGNNIHVLQEGSENNGTTHFTLNDKLVLPAGIYFLKIFIKGYSVSVIKVVLL